MIDENKQNSNEEKIDENESKEIVNEVVIEKQENNFPSSLQECVKEDKHAKDLMKWAKGIEKFGYGLLIALLVFGIIFSFKDSMQPVLYESLYERYHRMKFNFGAFMLNICVWIGFSFVEYYTFNFIAALLEALATIVQNTKISALVSLYKASKEQQ